MINQTPKVEAQNGASASPDPSHPANGFTPAQANPAAAQPPTPEKTAPESPKTIRAISPMPWRIPIARTNRAMATANGTTPAFCADAGPPPNFESPTTQMTCSGSYRREIPEFSIRNSAKRMAAIRNQKKGSRIISPRTRRRASERCSPIRMDGSVRNQTPASPLSQNMTEARLAASRNGVSASGAAASRAR